MKITLDHPESKFGFPVIVDDAGRAFKKTNEGLLAVMDRLKLSPYELAAMCGLDQNTIAKYLDGSYVTPANVLNVLGLVMRGRYKTPTSTITKKEAQVVTLRKAGLSFAEIGKRMGFSRQRANQIHQMAKAKGVGK